MNSAPTNRYETYVIDPNWNHTPIKPDLASNFLIVSSVVAALKFLYGEEEDGNQTFSFPTNWGTENIDFVLTFISLEKLKHDIGTRQDLHITDDIINDVAQSTDNTRFNGDIPHVTENQPELKCETDDSDLTLKLNGEFPDN